MGNQTSDQKFGSTNYNSNVNDFSPQRTGTFMPNPTNEKRIIDELKESLSKKIQDCSQQESIIKQQELEIASYKAKQLENAMEIKKTRDELFHTKQILAEVESEAKILTFRIEKDQGVIL